MTISAQEEKTAFLVSNKIRRAVCEKSEVVPPLQYYSERGESIYILDQSSHQLISKVYMHFDAAGILLAKLLIGDPPKSDLLEFGQINLADLQQLPSVESNFNDCLLEMHLFSGQGVSNVHDSHDLEELIEHSKAASPVVIGGCGRSGTTLLLSILGAHPAILAFPDELYAFYPRPFRLRRLLNAVRDFGEGRVWRRWCEKTPKNVRVFDDIATLFKGQVKIIHIVRDGRDVVTSHHPNDGSRYYISPERWVADVREGLNSEKVHLVRYEDLIRDARATLQGLCYYIEEEFDHRLLRHEKTSTVKMNKAWKNSMAEPLHTDGTQRWQLPENSERVEELLMYPGAVELMRELHYL